MILFFHFCCFAANLSVKTNLFEHKSRPLKQKFRDSQIVIITSSVVVSSVGIKRVVCMYSPGLDLPCSHMLVKHLSVLRDSFRLTRSMSYLYLALLCTCHIYLYEALLCIYHIYLYEALLCIYHIYIYHY